MSEIHEAVRVAAKDLRMVPIEQLVPYANNARKHDKRQIAQLQSSMRELGFVAPILIDGDNNVIAGHGRLEAARAEGMTEVPCVLVDGLNEAQRRAYILADNRLAELATWDDNILRLELKGLQTLRFDTGIIGFDAAAVESFASAPQASGGQNDTEQAGDGEEEADAQEDDDNPEYAAFVDKFKPKKTTDDCYTPPEVYETIKDWAIKEYSLEGTPIVRPFYPGGDYEHYDYPDGCVVLDNPPFSILSEICAFYLGRGIRFFLFAPSLTAFGGINTVLQINHIICDCNIEYENGAVVRTSFVTNLTDGIVAQTSPELTQLVNDTVDRLRKEKTVQLPKYSYPDHVVTAAMMQRYSKYGVDFRVARCECTCISALDAQAECGKAIYGGGLLLSDAKAAEKAAAEKAAAEKAAAERAAAERAAAERAAAERAGAVVWDLSEREREIVRRLGE